MRPRPPASLPAALLATLTLAAPAQAGPCPAVTIKVDNDIPGSGYSEEKPENWQTHNVGACTATYRYLSKYVGDLSSKGKAIWKPKIAQSGTYKVTTSFRATVNRTNDADYFLYDDLGGTVHKVINQAHAGDCTYEDLGMIYCQAGGQCRVVLDGTDDNKSDAADLTTFELVNCDDPPDGGAPGRCDGIRQNPAYEVCVETDTTCAGVFTDGAGCNAYCAAAGMTCVARFGGGPMCMKEAASIPCDANNGHASDYCECEGPPLMPDAGVPDAAGGGGSGGVGGMGSGGGGAGGGLSGAGGAAAGGAGGAGGRGGSAGTSTVTTGQGGAGASGTTGTAGGCACAMGEKEPEGLSWAVGVGLWMMGRARQGRTKRRV
ncbi:MAG: hypothetical protein U0359_08805 [Byssovorax sp.]